MSWEIVVRSYKNGDGLQETGRFTKFLYRERGLPREISAHIARELIKLKVGAVTDIRITIEGQDGRTRDSLGRKLSFAPVSFDRSLGARATAWRRSKGFSCDPAVVVAKLTEEVGELARALIGEWEKRPGRGDPLQEGAQVMIVLASLLDITHPEADVFQEVREEMKRLGA